MCTLMVKKLCSIYLEKKLHEFSYALHIFSVILVSVYLISVYGVFAPMTSLQDGELRLFQAENELSFHFCDR